MDTPINFKTRSLEDRIIELLNNETEVPMETKRLIVADVLQLVTKQADKEIAMEVVLNNNKGGQYELSKNI